VRLPAKRRLIVAISLIAQVFAGVSVHVAPAQAAEPTQPAIKQPLQIRETPTPKSMKPCHESAAAQGVDQAAKPASPVVKIDKAEKSDLARKACCKDGTCKCPASTPPAAIESRAATAPAACPAPRADGICEAPPSRLRPSVFFRPPI
jgi:hypothetical protein